MLVRQLYAIHKAMYYSRTTNVLLMFARRVFSEAQIYEKGVEAIFSKCCWKAGYLLARPDTVFPCRRLDAAVAHEAEEPAG